MQSTLLQTTTYCVVRMLPFIDEETEALNGYMICHNVTDTKYLFTILTNLNLKLKSTIYCCLSIVGGNSGEKYIVKLVE